jgi:TPR repeat protein
MQEAIKWYKQAAEGGDKRATKRLASNARGSTALDRRLEMEAMKEDSGITKGAKGDSCMIM